MYGAMSMHPKQEIVPPGHGGGSTVVLGRGGQTGPEGFTEGVEEGGGGGFQPEVEGADVDGCVPVDLGEGEGQGIVRG